MIWIIIISRQKDCIHLLGNLTQVSKIIHANDIFALSFNFRGSKCKASDIYEKIIHSRTLDSLVIFSNEIRFYYYDQNEYQNYKCLNFSWDIMKPINRLTWDIWFQISFMSNTVLIIVNKKRSNRAPNSSQSIEYDGNCPDWTEEILDNREEILDNSWGSKPFISLWTFIFPTTKDKFDFI